MDVKNAEKNFWKFKDVQKNKLQVCKASVYRHTFFAAIFINFSNKTLQHTLELLIVAIKRNFRVTDNNLKKIIPKM